MKLRKGDKLTFVGFRKDSFKRITEIVFETSQKNKIVITLDGEHDDRYLGISIVDEEKLSEEMDIP